MLLSEAQPFPAGGIPKQVPDPYYGGPQGFETVLDLLDDACTGLLRKIEEHESQAAAA